MLNQGLIFPQIEISSAKWKHFVCVQFGRLETVRWLVEKTRDGERLASREGERERCLLHTAARYGQVSIGSLINGSSADMIMTRVTKCQSDHWLRDCPQDDDLVTCGLSAIYPLGQCWTINVNYWINIPVFSPVRQNNEHKWERVNLWPLEMSFHSVQFWRYPIMARPHIMLRLGNISLNKIYLSSGGFLLSVEMFGDVWTDSGSSQ